MLLYFEECCAVFCDTLLLKPSNAEIVLKDVCLFWFHIFKLGKLQVCMLWDYKFAKHFSVLKF